MELVGKKGERTKDVAARVGELEEFCFSDRLSLHGLRKKVGDLSWEDVCDSSFLHRVCTNRTASLGAVEFLLEKYPEAASIPVCWDRCTAHDDHFPRSIFDDDRKYAFPVHAACNNDYCPDSVIQLLAAKNPSALSESCTIVNDDIFDFYDMEEQRINLNEYPVGGLPIHQYFERSSPSHIILDTVKLLVEKCPASLTTAEGPHGLIPLHTLLKHQNIAALHNIIQFLLDSNPSCARIVDNQGHLPIHAACLNIETSFEIFELLLNTWPDSALQTENSDRPPIHVWCGTRTYDTRAYAHYDETMGLRILNLFLEKYSAAVRQLDQDGFLPIYWLAKAKDFELFKCLYEEFPEAARIRMNGELLIHKACRLGSVGTVEYLLQIDPESITIRDDLGFLPIHQAFDNEHVEVVRLILPWCLDFASETTSWRNSLPLHLASESQAANSIDLVRALFDAYPEAINKHNDDGNSPLDIAMKHSNEECREFLQTNSAYAQRAVNAEAMATRDLNGQLPLHVALHDNVTLGAVKLLVNGFPAALEVPDHKGSFPLHIACSGGKCDVVKHLLKANAISVSKVNGEKKLPIHLLLECGEVDRHSIDYIDTIWSLLCAHPAIVSDWVPKH